MKIFLGVHEKKSYMAFKNLYRRLVTNRIARPAVKVVCTYCTFFEKLIFLCRMFILFYDFLKYNQTANEFEYARPREYIEFLELNVVMLGRVIFYHVYII